jgi:transposase InsO family protein
VKDLLYRMKLRIARSVSDAAGSRLIAVSVTLVQYVAASTSRGRLFASGCVDLGRKVKLASAREAVAPVIPRRLKVDGTLESIIIGIRRERRLGVKRRRNELQRLHTVRLSVATIHKVLVRHGLNNLPTRKRARHKPKRYERPVPGDRVQMDTCKIRPGVYQFTAIDDCSRYLVAGLSRRRSAAATLTFLDQVLPFSVQRIQQDRGREFFAEEVQRRLMAEPYVPAYSPTFAALERKG